MFSAQQLLIGLPMVAAGIAFVKFSFQISNFTGAQEWIERYVGAGMTNGVYKLFGVALVVLGIFIATGFGSNVMNFLFSPLLHVFAPLSH
jgi:hypothetical protein